MIMKIIPAVFVEKLENTHVLEQYRVYDSTTIVRDAEALSVRYFDFDRESWWFSAACF